MIFAVLLQFKFVVIYVFFRQIFTPKISEFTKKCFFPSLKVYHLNTLLDYTNNTNTNFWLNPLEMNWSYLNKLMICPVWQVYECVTGRFLTCHTQHTHRNVSLATRLLPGLVTASVCLSHLSVCLKTPHLKIILQ